MIPHEKSVEFERVSVHYTARRAPSAKELLVRGFRTASVRVVAALDDVSLTIHRGESVGIIGRNGAGKSTLLRIAAGIMTPTAGQCTTWGRIAPLIELGTGFDLELSGRENVFFNGSLLGRSKAAMAERIDEIIDFSELGPVIDSPLRTYSTGMVARLAFAVASAIDADVIMLDEILSVGDDAFQAKCRARIERFRATGATMLFVSHDLNSVAELCTRSVWIAGGRVVADGDPARVIDEYQTHRGSA